MQISTYVKMRYLWTKLLVQGRMTLRKWKIWVLHIHFDQGTILTKWRNKFQTNLPCRDIPVDWSFSPFLRWLAYSLVRNSLLIIILRIFPDFLFHVVRSLLHPAIHWHNYYIVKTKGNIQVKLILQNH